MTTTQSATRRPHHPPTRVSARAVAAALLLDEEHERNEWAARLHDEIGSALIAARMCGELAEECITEALAALRTQMRELRPRALDGCLGQELQALAEPGRVAVAADDPALDDLPAATASLAARIVRQALARTTRAVHIGAAVDASGLRLSVSAADARWRSDELATWCRRAAALDGHLDVRAKEIQLFLPQVDHEELR